MFLAVFALGCLTTRGLTHVDAALHLATADAIVGRGATTLELEVGDAWVPTRRLAGGLWFDDGSGLRLAATPGMASLALPGAALARPFADASLGARLAPLTRGEGPAAALRRFQSDPRVVSFVLLGPLFTALACAFVYRAAAALGLGRAGRWAATAGLAVGSPMLAYAGTTWTQVPVVAALALALWVVAARERRPRVSTTPVGLALALAVWVRPDALIYVPLFVAAVYFGERSWRRSPSRAVLRVLWPVAVAVGCVAVSGLPASGGGFALSELPRGLLGLTLGPEAGLLVYAPLAWAAPLAVRREPLAWALVGVPVATVLLYAGWFDWSASVAYGPRLLLPALPALALALGRVAERRPTLGAALVGLGALVSLPGALWFHGRLPEGDGFSWAPIHAWRALLAGDGGGERGVDCAATYVLAYAAIALGVALLGLAREASVVRARFSS